MYQLSPKDSFRAKKHYYIYLKLGAFFCLSFVLLACSSANKVPLQADPDVPVISTPQSPFSLQITTVLNDGNNLKVEGIITNKTAWYADKVSIRLVGFQNGVEVNSKSRPLKDFLNAQQLAPVSKDSQYGSSAQGISLAAETHLAFSVSLPAQNISDFQVTLGWGAEAVLASPELQVHWEQQGIVDLGVDTECVHAECPHFYGVEGYIINDGQETLSSVSLTLSLKDSSSNDSSATSADAEQLDLAPLSILPGKSQKVRLRFNKALLPQLIAGIKAEVVIKAANKSSETPVK